MSCNFKKLAEVEFLNEVPGNATVIAEVGGAVKRILGSGLGGGGSAKPVVIKVNFPITEEDGDRMLSTSGTLTIPNEQETINQVMTAVQDGNAPNVVFDISYNDLDTNDAWAYFCAPVMWVYDGDHARVYCVCDFSGQLHRVSVSFSPNDFFARRSEASL